ncbi:hypothetical protein L1N85_08165 [Paenibacillus alkaliterrae]|uniref:type II toxin-antitoxin system RelE family toxin n=1 Tax=Paenibacillus alkaliterrae TaxID=320909 RepID=UPI001F1B3257|nr:hypothetical protein [Paenibacillus alkaliterrae]MCF2938408.1 hypothetical protein [Paenibacillus alkaliterrae]
MLEERFDVRLDADAEKEYSRLDGSVLGMVNAAIDELIFRADEVGKPLSNYSETKLAGCKEIKLRDAGIRIVFRVTNEVVDILRIVYVLTIERRARDMAFKIAHGRLKAYRKLTKEQTRLLHEKQKKWSIE